MEPLVFGGLIVALVALRLIGARRLVRGQGRYAWLVFASMFLAPAGLFLVAATSWREQPVVSLFIGLIALTTLVLVWRFVHHLASTGGVTPPLGDLAKPYFDYLIWMSIGAPLILVGLLLVLAITGGLGGGR